MSRTPRVTSARARILGAILAVAFVGLVVAGSVTFVVQRERAIQNADSQLGAFVTTATADPSAAPDRLVQELVTGAAPGRSDGTFALRDGRVIASTPSTSGVDFADDARFVAEVADARTDAASPRTVRGEERRYRYVSVTRDDTVLVHAIDLDTRTELITLGVATYTISGAVMLVSIAIVGWFVTGRLLSPIQRLRDAADSITIDDLGTRIRAEGTDEIAELSRTVNSMLDRLEGSVDVQRQLLDDVRHELKTPITIVRGHLEIMRADDPGDVAGTREIAIAELDRMTRLVDDIDFLAGVEGENFTMGVIDLDALTTRVGELVTVIPHHTWSVEARAHGRIEGDFERLVQAWIQLADNAAKHTPEGTAIEIGSAMDEYGAQLWVRDHGPGIAPALRHRIFRRFDRAHGRRDVGGSGLGLAIVEAITRGHDGHCAVTDTPGGGATFTIHVPARAGTAPAELPAPVRAGDVVMQREATG